MAGKILSALLPNNFHFSKTICFDIGVGFLHIVHPELPKKGWYQLELGFGNSERQNMVS